MTVVTLRPEWQDIIIDPGRRPNTKFIFTDGMVAGYAINRKVFEGEFLWPAVPANSSSDFILFETTVTAAGLQDLFSIEKEGKTKLPRSKGAKIIMEVLRGESVMTSRYFTQVPLNTMQAIHPNNNIGRARVQMDQIFGWDYPGFESPFENPTSVSRLLVTENLRMSMGMRNPQPFEVRNSTRIIFNVLEWMPLDPARPEDIPRLVKIIKGEIPSVEWSPGLAQDALSTFKDDFNVSSPVKVEDGKVVVVNTGQVIG